MVLFVDPFTAGLTCTVTSHCGSVPSDETMASVDAGMALALAPLLAFPVVQG